MLAILLDSIETLCILESSAFPGALSPWMRMTSRKELAHLSRRSQRDAYTLIHCAPRPRKFESRPQARHWRSNETAGEGDRPCAIVENHSQLEVIAAGLGQLSE